MYVCMYACMHACMQHGCMYVCMYMYVCVCMYMYVYVCMCMYVYINIHIGMSFGEDHSTRLLSSKDLPLSEVSCKNQHPIHTPMHFQSTQI